MLRKLKIGARLNILVVLPLVAVLAIAAAAVFGVRRASIDGPETQRLLTATQLEADFSPSATSLAAAWADVLRIRSLATAQQPDQAKLAELFVRLDNSHAAYDERISFWANGQSAEITGGPLTAHEVFGVSFWESFEQAFIPGVQAGDVAAMDAAIDRMQSSYDAYSAALDGALSPAQRAASNARADASQFSSQLLTNVAAVALGSALILVLLGWRVRRSIVGPMHELSQRARQIADRDLPDAVRLAQQLNDGDESPRIPCFVLNGGTEFDELADSFASVHRAAVDLAHEQADERRAVAANLVNVGRRNQGLLDRTLRFISDLERDERDPEALDHLFQLDHLTTRMRRQAQSLLVLAGATPNRPWSSPLDAGDVVRAALSQIEDYARVGIGEVGSARVLGSAAGDVAHLLAELLENGASFSPPTHEVRVVGRLTPKGYVFAIADYGIGMSAAELESANARLAQTNGFGAQTGRMLGFQVVSRLAAAHGIEVSLAPTAGGTGITAIVEVPAALLAATEVAPPGAVTNVATVQPSTPFALAPVGPIAPVAPVLRPAALPDPAPSPEPFATVPVPVPVPVPTLVASSLAAQTLPAPTVPEPTLPSPTLPSPTLPELAERRVSMPPITMVNGLSKRVRGAQMPDLGRTRTVEQAPAQDAEQTRTQLSSLQRGVRQARDIVDNQAVGGV